MTQFVITAMHPEKKEVLRLHYDNETNVMATEDGHVFKDPSASNRSFGFESRPFSKEKPLRKSHHVKLLKLQLGLSCNYACDYCSQRFVERAPETSKKDIDAFMAALDNLSFSEQAGLKIELWGGEPLVYWKTIKPLVEALQERFKSWKSKPRFSLITNGSILTPEICYWLMTNEFMIGISHDGPGQHVRGPDPLADPEQRKIILDFWRQMHRMGRISFNSMLNASNTSRKAIYEWFAEVTGDPSVRIGEGGLVDAYDDGGMANLLDTKQKHFEFRKQAYNDIFSTNGEINFVNTLQKIDGFIEDVLRQNPAKHVGQKCGMDSESTIAIDLRGNVLTCQNVSASSVSHNGEAHHSGNIADMGSVAIKTSTHWRNRPMCSQCPVLHICKGSCMFLDGDNWTASCENAYSDAVVLFALGVEKLTKGFVPVLIEGGDLPPERRDIWGDLLPHVEAAPKRRAFPVKVVADKQVVEGVEVFTRSEVIGG